MYELIEQEHLSSTINLRLDRLVDAYEVIADLSDTPTLANLKVLALISAADANDERSEAFLYAAKALNEWLIGLVGDEPTHLVNRWQILWRLGRLTAVHRRGIRRLKREMTKSDIELGGQIEFACALLLGENEEADYCLEQLAPEKYEQLRTLPIWALRGPKAKSAVAATAV